MTPGRDEAPLQGNAPTLNEGNTPREALFPFLFPLDGSHLDPPSTRDESTDEITHDDGNEAESITAFRAIGRWFWPRFALRPAEKWRARSAVSTVLRRRAAA